mmetsp:Transcript_76109/g.182031  ORF Transcript_76109/g.182031 Transcript_76109/m.182031 type:complete len:344 (+) Transcript_76109:1370-2401(+)
MQLPFQTLIPSGLRLVHLGIVAYLGPGNDPLARSFEVPLQRQCDGRLQRLSGRLLERADVQGLRSHIKFHLLAVHAHEIEDPPLWGGEILHRSYIHDPLQNGVVDHPLHHPQYEQEVHGSPRHLDQSLGHSRRQQRRPVGLQDAAHQEHFLARHACQLQPEQNILVSGVEGLDGTNHQGVAAVDTQQPHHAKESAKGQVVAKDEARCHQQDDDQLDVEEVRTGSVQKISEGTMRVGRVLLEQGMDERHQGCGDPQGVQEYACEGQYGPQGVNALGALHPEVRQLHRDRPGVVHYGDREELRVDAQQGTQKVGQGHGQEQMHPNADGLGETCQHPGPGRLRSSP